MRLSALIAACVLGEHLRGNPVLYRENRAGSGGQEMSVLSARVSVRRVLCCWETLGHKDRAQAMPDREQAA